MILKSYGYSFLLHILLGLLLLGGWVIWKKPEPPEVHFIQTQLVTLASVSPTHTAAIRRPISQQLPHVQQKPPTSKPVTTEIKPTVKKEEKKLDKMEKKTEASDEQPAPTKKLPAPEKQKLNTQELKDFLNEENQEIAQLQQHVNQQAQQTADQAAIAEYVGLIKQKIQRHWTKSLTTNDSIKVTLKIVMLPGGEVINVSVLASSGNAVFDRSATQAVQKAKTLPVPNEMRLFNQYFKILVVLFRSDDL